MTTDFRSLCAELVTELQGYASANPHHDSDALVARARAALSQPQPPAGEVGELVAWLHGQDGGLGRRAIYSRIADLLERLANYPGSPDSSPQPIPVSERLPEAGDCAPWGDCADFDPWCWCGKFTEGGWEWMQFSASVLTSHFVHRGFTHWLPAQALPLPAAEVE